MLNRGAKNVKVFNFTHFSPRLLWVTGYWGDRGRMTEGRKQKKDYERIYDLSVMDMEKLS